MVERKNMVKEVGMGISRRIFSGAAREMGRHPVILLFSVLVAGFFFWIMMMTVVWTTPGATLLFHLSILDPAIIVFVALLALLNGLLVGMQIVLQMKKVEAKRKLERSATAGSVFLSLLASSIACTACYSSVLAFFGLGLSTAVYHARFYLLTGAFLLSMYAFYHTSKAISGYCDLCVLPKK